MELSIEKYYNTTVDKAGMRDESGIAARQLIKIYLKSMEYPGGTFLELGTDRGQASKIILAACERHGGRLVSVDIRDCSTAAVSQYWEFVQSSSVDRPRILREAPLLGNGIDLVYIDSLHTPDHVYNEISTWFDLLNEGASIFFDDVDPMPYMKGRRKDNAMMEIDNRNINELIMSVFYTNMDQLRLNIEYGSTGLACLEKISPLGAKLNPPQKLPKARRGRNFHKLIMKLGGKSYRHKRDGSDML